MLGAAVHEEITASSEVLCHAVEWILLLDPDHRVQERTPQNFGKI